MRERCRESQTWGGGRRKEPLLCNRIRKKGGKRSNRQKKKLWTLIKSVRKEGGETDISKEGKGQTPGVRDDSTVCRQLPT